MQNQYVGDFGDFVKYGLLRALSKDKRLGVAWYLYPNGGGTDGNKIAYLDDPNTWQSLDPTLFNGLKRIVKSERRCVKAVQDSGLLPEAVFASEMLRFDTRSNVQRAEWRREWFKQVKEQLSDCDIVFADPDNCLWLDERFGYARRNDWKRMPLSEALQLAEGRTAIFYYHNTRRAGGHCKEIRHWMNKIPGCNRAFYCNKDGFRTFFVVTHDAAVMDRLTKFAEKWQQAGELIKR